MEVRLCLNSYSKPCRASPFNTRAGWLERWPLLLQPAQRIVIRNLTSNNIVFKYLPVSQSLSPLHKNPAIAYYSCNMYNSTERKPVQNRLLPSRSWASRLVVSALSPCTPNRGSSPAQRLVNPSVPKRHESVYALSEHHDS